MGENIVEEAPIEVLELEALESDEWGRSIDGLDDLVRLPAVVDQFESDLVEGRFLD